MVNITPASVDDARAIAEVHVRSWQAAYAGILKAEFLHDLSIDDRARRWGDILREAVSQVLVARHGDRVVGFVSAGRCRDEGAAESDGEIWALYVHPADWGRGAGRALVARAVEALRAQGCTTVSLWVLGENRRGLGFYQACGFAPVPGSARRFELGGSEVEEVCLRLQPGD